MRGIISPAVSSPILQLPGPVPCRSLPGPSPTFHLASQNLPPAASDGATDLISHKCLKFHTPGLKPASKGSPPLDALLMLLRESLPSLGAQLQAYPVSDLSPSILFPGSLKSHNPPHSPSFSHHLSTLAVPKPLLTSLPPHLPSLAAPSSQHLQCGFGHSIALPEVPQSSPSTQKHHCSSCPQGTRESMALMGHVADPSPMKLLFDSSFTSHHKSPQVSPSYSEPHRALLLPPENTVHSAS